MKFQIVNKDMYCQVGNVLPGTTVEYAGCKYITMDRTKTGEGCHIHTTIENAVVLFNPKYGSIRQVPPDTLVKVFQYAAPVPLIELEGVSMNVVLHNQIEDFTKG